MNSIHHSRHDSSSQSQCGPKKPKRLHRRSPTAHQIKSASRVELKRPAALSLAPANWETFGKSGLIHCNVSFSRAGTASRRSLLQTRSFEMRGYNRLSATLTPSLQTPNLHVVRRQRKGSE